jgi:dihydrofolate reductase
MRKIILSFGMSLDGYIARPDGAVDFLPRDKGAVKLMSEFFATIDTVIMGRKTLDAAIQMSGGSYKSPVKIPTYVFSKTQPPGKYDGYEIVNQSPAALVRKLRQKPGKHIFHMGGGELGRTFLKADLIDELFLGIVPVFLGDGIPAFPAGFPQRRFALIENRTLSKSSIVLRYRRVKAAQKKTTR